MGYYHSGTHANTGSAKHFLNELEDLLKEDIPEVTGPILEGPPGAFLFEGAIMPAIRLVLFDAFSTLLVPRFPVYVQYSQVFKPYLGVLEPEKLKVSFKIGRRCLL